jgi:glycine/D-amino acid oxidase-like deaminating enzyme
MQGFDWIVVGAGITGAALGYELAKQGFSVLLIDRSGILREATRHSYGGIAYWAGNSDLTQTICAESWDIHQNLSAELDADTQFRQMELVLTIAPEEDAAAIATDFAQFALPPQILTPKEAQDLEPLLDPNAIQQALLLPHGHIEPELTAQAYRSAMARLGGKTLIANVTQVGSGQVTTDQGNFAAANIALCAGATTRQILQQMGISIPQYFSYAESIEIPPGNVKLRTIVMSAITRRFELEGQASTVEQESRWQQPHQQLMPAVMDMGALQCQNGQIRMGQISRTLSDPNAQLDAASSEAWIRQQVGQVLPTIAQLPGQWCACRVAFSRDHLPIVGELPNKPGIHIFSGFSNPLALVPGIARRYAISATGKPDELLKDLGVDRFN